MFGACWTWHQDMVLGAVSGDSHDSLVELWCVRERFCCYEATSVQRCIVKEALSLSTQKLCEAQWKGPT